MLIISGVLASIVFKRARQEAWPWPPEEDIQTEGSARTSNTHPLFVERGVARLRRQPDRKANSEF